MEPQTLIPKPSYLITFAGGVIGMVLFFSVIFLAPSLGLPFIQIPWLLGGIFTSDQIAALWLGFWLFFLTGVFIFSPFLVYMWAKLPGKRIGYSGAFLKGFLWGIILWILTGLLLPLIGVITRVQGIDNPGFFALGMGIEGPLVLLAAHLGFGLTVGLIAAMSQGITPLGTLGWFGHYFADVREAGLRPEERID
jgi:hypothetical protein